MKIAHLVKVSVFCKEGEDFGAVKSKFLGLFPFKLEDERVELKEQTATGFKESKIKILEVELKKEKLINLFLENLIKNFNNEQKEPIIKQLDSRVDDECNFFIRLDKGKLLEGKYWITDKGDCFHIRVSVAAFPAKKEKAIEVLKEIFKKVE